MKIKLLNINDTYYEENKSKTSKHQNWKGNIYVNLGQNGSSFFVFSALSNAIFWENDDEKLIGFGKLGYATLN